jgi:ubiquinone/menaquinone biosynthesis C-methylase UbiE
MTLYDHDNRRLAEIYDKISDSQFDGGKKIVERLGIKAGYRVLDVGCGTGRLACWIYERVGPSGTVVGIDPLAERIAVARNRNSDIHFAVGSAEDLGCFPDESFDAVCLSAVFHWIEDKSKALAEIRRVLRPGGQLGGTTVPKELFWVGTMPTICASVFGRPPYLESLNPSMVGVMHQYLTTTELVTLLVEQRFELIEFHLVRRAQVLQSGEAVVDFAESSSFGNFLSLVPDDLRASLRADLAVAFDKNRGDNGITLRQFATLFVAERSHTHARDVEP